MEITAEEYRDSSLNLDLLFGEGGQIPTKCSDLEFSLHLDKLFELPPAENSSNYSDIVTPKPSDLCHMEYPPPPASPPS